MRRRGNISKRCMVCIMSAMMMMSSVTGTMISSIGVYAQDYATIGDMTADENGKYNLTSEDTLTLNNGTIHENNGTIVENAAGATVEINNNEIQKNEGIVVENAAGATVGTQNETIIGEVTNNYGIAENSLVESNYGTANNSKVSENFSTGRVTGAESTVSTNHAGFVEEGINIEVNEIIVPQNKPAETIEAAPASDTENSNDDNSTQRSVGSEFKGNLDAAVNGLPSASWNGTSIVLSDGKILTLEKLAELECESSGYADVFGKGFKTKYEQEFLWAIEGGKTVAEARDIVQKSVMYFIDKILDLTEEEKLQKEYLYIYDLKSEDVSFDENNSDYVKFAEAYRKAVWKEFNENIGVSLSVLSNSARRDAIYAFDQPEILNSIYAIVILNNKRPIDAKRVVEDVVSENVVFGYNKKQIDLYLQAFQKAIEEKIIPTIANKIAKEAVEEAGDLSEDEPDNNVNAPVIQNGGQADQGTAELSGQSQAVAINQANAANAQLQDMARGREIYDSKTDKWYWLDADAYVYKNEKAFDEEAVRDLISKELENAQLSEDGTMLVSPNGKSVSTTDLAFAETASIDSVYINADAKANLFMTVLNAQLANMSPGKATTEASRIVADLENDLRKDIPKGLSKEEENTYVKEYVEEFRHLISEGQDYQNAKNCAEILARQMIVSESR